MIEKLKLCATKVMMKIIVSDVWVSSDDDQILQVAEKYGAKIIKRPNEISGDSSTSESA